MYEIYVAYCLFCWFSVFTSVNFGHLRFSGKDKLYSLLGSSSDYFDRYFLSDGNQFGQKIRLGIDILCRFPDRIDYLCRSDGYLCNCFCFYQIWRRLMWFYDLGKHYNDCFDSCFALGSIVRVQSSKQFAYNCFGNLNHCLSYVCSSRIF